ncbi:phosphopantetheine-binding protein [Streptomyces sp. NPDC050161]|uniref:phosphopantetheine-binding protein n=1 Tax=Streptomyces sp. NPDC050161 TaxID=3365604 RepID=UPI0037AEC93D
MVSQAEPTQQISRESVRTAISQIWQEVLRIDVLSGDDNFFELGGHSLTASQVIARITRTLQVEVPMADFFEGPTVDELAELVVRRRGPEGGTPE